MVNYETVKFIGMLNELAERSKSAEFVPVRTKDVCEGLKLYNFMGLKFCYDVSVPVQADESFIYFRLIKRFGKDGFVYYPHVFVAVPRDSRENDRCVFAFVEEDWNEDKEIIIQNGHWSVCEDL